MARLTKTEAARQLGISRTTLYKLIDQNVLSTTPDGLIDTAELGRVLSTMNVHHARPRSPVNTNTTNAFPSHGEHAERPMDLFSEHQSWTSSERQLTSSHAESERQLTSSYRDLVDILREQLQAAQERERDYREHIAHLTTMLDQAHQQNQRLLDLPRPAPPSPVSGDAGPPPAPARAVPRGEMRRRIVALLQEYPKGLSPVQVRQKLASAKELRDTMKHMVRDGLLWRVETGRYTVAPPSTTTSA